MKSSLPKVRIYWLFSYRTLCLSPLLCIVNSRESSMGRPEIATDRRPTWSRGSTGLEAARCLSASHQQDMGRDQCSWPRLRLVTCVITFPREPSQRGSPQRGPYETKTLAAAKNAHGDTRQLTTCVPTRLRWGVLGSTKGSDGNSKVSLKNAVTGPLGQLCALESGTKISTQNLQRARILDFKQWLQAFENHCIVFHILALEVTALNI